MFKKLDLLIIRSFIGPFVVTFFVALFVLVMQFFWLYMDELIGKGLGAGMILQLLLYMSTTLVPLALPLGVLLASIMTFGDMGEFYELVAIKSAGISLTRFMRPLFVFVFAISTGAFFFNNNVIPIANLKAFSLLYDLRNSKPALNIRPGIFNNDIAGFSIKVGQKDEDGRTIHNIIIYDQNQNLHNNQVVFAKRGVMLPSKDKHYLIFRLEDGWRYQEGGANSGIPTMNVHAEQIRMHFRRWDKVFDLSGFKVSRTSEDLFRDAQVMMDVTQLWENRQLSLTNRKRDVEMTRVFMSSYLTLLDTNAAKKSFLSKIKSAKGDIVIAAPPKPVIAPEIISADSSSTSISPADSLIAAQDLKPYAPDSATFLARVPLPLRAAVISKAITNARNQKSQLDFKSNQDFIFRSNLRKYDVELHRKFTLSFACLLLFFIGAPLGAIIRKGGIGMPLVVAIGFFVVYFFVSTIGQNLATSGEMRPWLGMWMSTLVLIPVAIFLTIAARNDAPIFNRETYTRLWYRLTSAFSKKKSA